MAAVAANLEEDNDPFERGSWEKWPPYLTKSGFWVLGVCPAGCTFKEFF